MSGTNGVDGIADSSADVTGRYVVLQALADLVLETDLVIEDGHSRTILRNAYRAATDSHQRDGFEWLLDGTEASSEATDSNPELVQEVVDGVYARLVEEEVSATLDHAVTASIDPREVALFNFVRSKSPAVLEDIPLSPEVRHPVLKGAESVEAEKFEQALTYFEAALTHATTTNDEITPRVLAAWTHHWNGDDGYALDLVDEALHLEHGAWSPRLIGAVADHSSPGLFRDGQLTVRAYLRVVATVSAPSSITPAVRYPDERRAAEWEDLPGDLDCTRLPTLATETTIRLRLAGPLGSMPTVQAYYLAIGVVEAETNVPRSIIRQVLTGPSGAEPLEYIKFLR